MELRHLRYFVAVAEEGSLTVAAERRLHSLSRQIRDLEYEVGAQLLALHPVDGLIKIFDLLNPKTCYQVICVGKRPGRHRPRCPFEPNPRAQRTGLQAFCRLDDSGFGEFFIEFLHVRQELLARQLAGFRILRCLDDHHDFHWLLLSLVVLSSACFPLEPFGYTQTLHSTHRPDCHDFYG
jgi:Bacterial regulatory helix-turn-helix protein, lysR family